MEGLLVAIEGLGISPTRLLWVGGALLAVVAIGAIGRAVEWLRGIRSVLAEHDARLMLLERWARTADTKAIHAEVQLESRRRRSDEATIYDEITKVGSPKTSITDLMREVSLLAEENFEQARTVDSRVASQTGVFGSIAAGTSVLGARAKRLFSRKA